MDLRERFIRTEVLRNKITTRSGWLADWYGEMGATPPGVTTDDHAIAINEDYLEDIDKCAYSGSMTWIEAAELTIQAIDKILEERDGT